MSLIGKALLWGGGARGRFRQRIFSELRGIMGNYSFVSFRNNFAVIIAGRFKKK